MRIRISLAFALTTALSACAGTQTSDTQEIPIQTSPAAAACTVQRGGTALGVVDPTPGSLSVDHSDKDLTVTCRKPGFQTTTATVKAVYQGVGLGRLLSGGAAGVVEDAAKSANFRYDDGGSSVTMPPAPATVR